MNKIKIKIFLDFGHGGSDSGAVSGNLIEKVMNLITGQECKSILQQYDIEVMTSRDIDKTVSLAERVRMANEWVADYFVSIHYNAGGGDRGEVIHSIYRGNGLALANSIAASLKTLGQSTMKIYERRGEDNKDYYYVIKNTNMDAIIVEGGFIDNAVDRQLFDTPEEQKALGRAIAYGILNYLAIPIKEDKPKKYWVVSNYIPKGEYGFACKAFIDKYLYDIPEFYVNTNPTGPWIETCYLPLDKCEELKERLGNLFWGIEYH